MKRIDDYISDYVVFDLETTGVNPDDQIIEIAAIRVKDSQMIESFATLVKPTIHIPIEASSVNHITDDMVEESPLPAAALEGFKKFIGDSVLLGHNIEAFDLKFIQRDLSKYLDESIDNDYVDTVLIARSKLDFLSSRSLKTLSEYYNISYQGAHRALKDCGINYMVYEKMMTTDVRPKDKVIKSCPNCSSGQLKLRNSKYGWFWGCSNYPDCKHTEKYI